jgi:hypothetical protein
MSHECELLDAGALTPGLPAVKPAWAAALRHVTELRRRSVFPAAAPLPHRWLDIGPGYCYGPAFGHFDLVHQVLDFVADDPVLARDQMLNLFAVQRPDGVIPFVWMGENPARTWPPQGGPYPPLWTVGVEACLKVEPNESLLAQADAALERTLDWFDAHRRAPGGGYFYADIFGKGQWESGMDQSIRFAQPLTQPAACVDASSHVFWCLRFAVAWAKRLGKDAGPREEALAQLGAWIRDALFCPATGWFHDAWTVNAPARRHRAFEGLWPLIVGAASAEQAAVALSDSLLHPDRFNTPHPIATVSRDDPAFRLQMWNGPAWNSFTLWAVAACLQYGRPDGARELLEKALDHTATEFERTGTVFEFYHPLGGHAETVTRKPGRAQVGPCRDYLGHNPLHAMARVWAAQRPGREDDHDPS